MGFCFKIDVFSYFLSYYLSAISVCTLHFKVNGNAPTGELYSHI